MRFRKILLVDDDKVCQYLYAELLQEMQLAEQLVLLPNGQLALDYLTQHCGPAGTCPDLILLDLKMPVMDGLELLDQLTRAGRADLVRTAVVLLTTSEHAWDQLRARQLRVKDYLVKPLTEEKIEGFLRRHYPIDGPGQ
ncbi:MAG: response regulator [Cytophagales bacterium]|nr:response regulator [Cytophagales bacterium]